MSNRKRTRAIRTDMARTGDNYTRVANRAGGTSASTDSNNRTDAVREHVRRVLEAMGDVSDKKEARAQELERAGYRLVGGGQTGFDTWEITDWRTGDIIAEGDNGPHGYNEANDRLDPDERFYHADHLYEGFPPVEIITPGVPKSLGRAILEDWIERLNTPAEEIAEFVGWPVEKVRQHLETT